MAVSIVIPVDNGKISFLGGIVDGHQGKCAVGLVGTIRQDGGMLDLTIRIIILSVAVRILICYQLSQVLIPGCGFIQQ